MTVNERIIAALNFGIPVVPDVYTGSAREYITFNYNTVGDDHADDEPGHERVFVQVHFLCPLDVDGLSRRKQIKQKLWAAGFTWPSETDATDEEGQHWIFECELAEGVELNG